MWGQSAMEDVHICACNTRSMSHHSIFRFKATLGHFSSSHVCAKLWSFSLRLKLNFMILFISNFNWIHGVGWACCPKGPWKLRHCIHSTHPGFDISVRFHHSTGIPVAQHVQRMMALGTLAGFPDVLGEQLILIHTSSVHQTNGWHHISMQVNGKLGYVLVFFLISSAARFMKTWCYQTTAELLNS